MSDDKEHSETEVAMPAPAPAREPVFNLAPVVVAFIAICALVHVLRAFVLDPDQDTSLLLRFAFFPIRYSGGYDLDIYALVSPVSYSLLHGDFVHLGVNMIWLAAFGSPLANRIGASRFVLFWIATSVGAVALHYVLFQQSVVPLVGASGAISGMMGAAARFAFRIDRTGPRPAFGGPVLSIPEVLSNRAVMVFLGIWMIVNVVTGLGVGAAAGMEGQIAWQAHIGGFIVGFFALRLFDRPFPPASDGLEMGR